MFLGETQVILPEQPTQTTILKQYDNIKGAACSEQSTENYQLNLPLSPLPSALQKYSFDSLFGCLVPHFTDANHAQAFQL